MFLRRIIINTAVGMLLEFLIVFPAGLRLVIVTNGFVLARAPISLNCDDSERFVFSKAIVLKVCLLSSVEAVANYMRTYFLSLSVLIGRRPVCDLLFGITMLIVRVCSLCHSPIEYASLRSIGVWVQVLVHVLVQVLDAL